MQEPSNINTAYLENLSSEMSRVRAMTWPLPLHQSLEEPDIPQTFAPDFLQANFPLSTCQIDSTAGFFHDSTPITANNSFRFPSNQIKNLNPIYLPIQLDQGPINIASYPFPNEVSIKNDLKTNGILNFQSQNTVNSFSVGYLGPGQSNVVQNEFSAENPLFPRPIESSYLSGIDESELPPYIKYSNFFSGAINTILSDPVLSTSFENNASILTKESTGIEASSGFSEGIANEQLFLSNQNLIENPFFFSPDSNLNQQNVNLTIGIPNQEYQSLITRNNLNLVQKPDFPPNLMQTHSQPLITCRVDQGENCHFIDPSLFPQSSSQTGDLGLTFNDNLLERNRLSSISIGASEEQIIKFSKAQQCHSLGNLSISSLGVESTGIESITSSNSFSSSSISGRLGPEWAAQIPPRPETHQFVKISPQAAQLMASCCTERDSSKKTGGPRRNPWGRMSYSELITLAIQSSSEKRMTLAQIYEWMIQNFDYFRERAQVASSAGWKVCYFFLFSVFKVLINYIWSFVKICNKGLFFN